MACVLGWIETHPGTASWVQAIGVFVAVIAAFMVADSQTRATLRLRKLEMTDRLAAIGAVIGLA